MPTREKLHTPTDASDFGPETDQGSFNTSAGDLFAAKAHLGVSDIRWNGSGSPPTRYALGVSKLTVPTSVAPVTGAGAAGTFDITATPGAGNDAVEYSIFLDIG